MLYKARNACLHNVTLRARPCNHFCSEKARSITYSECFVCSLRYQAHNGLSGSTILFHIIS